LLLYYDKEIKMNSQQKKEFEYRILQSIKYSSRSGSKIGFVKCWKGVSYEHFRVMSDIVWYLVNKGYKVFTEVEFNDSGRADILCIGNGMAWIIEVLKSETKDMFLNKLEYYPKDITDIVPIRVEEWNINNAEEILGL